ncbi:MAG: DUF302 domain-containing protein [Bacteroidales bacterium]|jgi:uncharacterized protein (DUF302 family)
MKDADNKLHPFLENLSPYSFDTTIEKLSLLIQEKQWKISHIYDLQKTLHDHGKEILAVKVISLCHPRHSGKLLATDDERIVSSLMPCRISVYEKTDGKTYISRLNSSMLSPLIGDLAADVMSRSAADVEEIIRLALQ